MKKNIVIIAVVITNLLSLMYAFVQRAEAEAQHKFAQQARSESEEMHRALADAMRASEAEKKVAEQLYLEAKNQAAAKTK